MIMPALPDVERIPALGRVEGALMAAIHEAAEHLSAGQEESLDLLNRSARVRMLDHGDYQVILYAHVNKDAGTSLEMDSAGSAEAIACITYGWLVHGQLGTI